MRIRIRLIIKFMRICYNTTGLKPSEAPLWASSAFVSLNGSTMSLHDFILSLNSGWDPVFQNKADPCTYRDQQHIEGEKKFLYKLNELWSRLITWWTRCETSSRCVISSPASNSATTAFSTCIKKFSFLSNKLRRKTHLLVLQVDF